MGLTWPKVATIPYRLVRGRTRTTVSARQAARVEPVGSRGGLFGAQHGGRLDSGGRPAGPGGGQVSGEERAGGDRQYRGGRYGWTGSHAELVGHQPPGPAAAGDAQRHAEQGGEQREGRGLPGHRLGDLAAPE